MHIRIEVERTLQASASRAQVLDLLQDIEGTLRRFPKLRKLHALGERDYRLDMQTIGSKVAKIAHDASFGARCSIDPAEGELSWEPIPKIGNALLEGRLRVIGESTGSRLSLRVSGELHDVPVPLMYRLVAPAFIQGKFSALADGYLEKIAAAAAGASSRASV